MAAAAVIAFTAPLTAAPAQANTEFTVMVMAMTFQPSTLRVHIGDTVTWVFNSNGTVHNVTAIQKGTTHDYFESGDMVDGTYSFEFTQPGTYQYVCTEHSSQGGKIIVT